MAARWADLHPPESIHSAATFTVPGCEHEEPIAGEGAPLVAEFCLAELGTVLGISTTAAKKLVGHALELRHRLPRLWAQVQPAGSPHGGPVWSRRPPSTPTPSLTREAAAFVDAQVAAVAGRVGTAQLDRLVAEAIRRYDLAEVDPAADPEDGYLYVDPRHATIHDDDVHFAGTMRLEAELDIADALDLDRAIAHGAESLKALGSDASLDARRSAALGDLARTQTALDLHARGATGARDVDDLPAAREVVLHAHFDASLDGLSTVFGPTGRMEEGQRLVLLDQVKDWCADSRTKVTIKPVIDLNAQLSTPAYEVPDRIREQVILRDRTCVFPWCTRPARGCDIDHVDEYDHARRGRRPTTTRARRRPTTSPRCAASTTASRPTPPGATGWSSPGSSSGPARTATTTDATAPAPRDRPSSHPTRPTSRDPVDHDPAPHPAIHEEAGPQAGPGGALPVVRSSGAARPATDRRHDREGDAAAHQEQAEERHAVLHRVVVEARVHRGQVQL